MDNSTAPHSPFQTCYQVWPAWAPDGHTILAQVIFPADFFPFAGHFPGDPILPGFMQVELALDMLARMNLPATLQVVDKARFFIPIRPDQSIHVSILASMLPRVQVEFHADCELCSAMELSLASATDRRADTAHTS